MSNATSTPASRQRAIAARLGQHLGIPEIKLRDRLLATVPAFPDSWPLRIMAPALSAQGLLPAIAVKLAEIRLPAP